MLIIKISDIFLGFINNGFEVNWFMSSNWALSKGRIHSSYLRLWKFIYKCTIWYCWILPLEVGLGRWLFTGFLIYGRSLEWFTLWLRGIFFNAKIGISWLLCILGGFTNFFNSIFVNRFLYLMKFFFSMERENNKKNFNKVINQKYVFGLSFFGFLIIDSMIFLPKN